MPQLKPETISMTGLNLFQHLCNLARLATSAYDSSSNCEVHSSGSQNLCGFSRYVLTDRSLCLSVVVWYGSAVGNRAEGSVCRHQPRCHPVHQLLLHQRSVNTVAEFRMIKHFLTSQFFSQQVTFIFYRALYIRDGFTVFSTIY